MFYQPTHTKQMLFGGRVDKINSLVAAYASCYFNVKKFSYLNSDKFDNTLLATFDARVFQTPHKEEACNVILWRWQDCSRNAIQLVAQSHFSHKELHGVNTKDLIEKLWVEKQVDFFAYEPSLRYGKLYLNQSQLTDGAKQGIIDVATLSKKYEFDFAKADNKSHILFDGIQPVYNDFKMPKVLRNNYNA